ncbi:MAG: futalosine hydrolase [Deltaproteobacteria bacterium]|nr:futalosine hydrolase [Deltaproteobacteria bacterium]MBW2067858.1 futalosine hydrolase [Deltaproteobacteria bacterium]
MADDGICFLVPTEVEAKTLLRRITYQKLPSRYELTMWQVKLGKRKDLLVVSGIGKVNAAFAIGAICSMNHIRLVIHFGICGAYPSSNLHPGDVILVTRSIFADEGVLYENQKIADYQDIGIPVLRCSGGEKIYESIRPDHFTLSAAKKIVPEGQYGNFTLKHGTICSVSMTSGSENVAKMRFDMYGAIAEDMETSAVLLGAAKALIPAVAVRGVSNYAGDRNKSEWKTDLALQNATSIVVRLVEHVDDLVPLGQTRQHRRTIQQ